MTHHKSHSEADQVSAWAQSGAMALTGRTDQSPLGPPRDLVPKLGAVAASIEQSTARLGRPVVLDPLALLSERAAIAGFGRRGAISCGGATRLLPTADGWLAVSLPRADDVDLVAAWLECDPLVGDVWTEIATEVGRGGRTGDELIERAGLVGLPVAMLPDAQANTTATAGWSGLPVLARRIPGPAPTARSLQDVRVLDLSSLWAGPLCGSILADAGAEVVKVESTDRPDGARSGPAAFFDLMNGAKRSVAIDLRSAEGVAALGALIEHSDVVIEASRPRALEQLGLHAETVVGHGRTRVWVSITGHGRTGDNGTRVAFGDDAAVAGGLVCWDRLGPCFCADAVADPATGLVAAAAALEALGRGGRWLIDAAMARVAGHLAGPTIEPGLDVLAATPIPRAAARRSPPMGEHTASVLAEATARSDPIGPLT